MSGHDPKSDRILVHQSRSPARRTLARSAGARSFSSCSSLSGRGGRVAGAWLAVALAVHIMLLATGCSRPPSPSPAGLLEQFALASQVAERSSLKYPFVVYRAGLKKNAMVLVAPIKVKAPLEGLQGRIELQLLVVPVFNVGDGIQMDIWLHDQGSSVKVCSRYFDPGRRFEDRRWLPLTVPMDVRRKDAQFEIDISGGPEGSLTGDWLAFADMRISVRAER